MKHLAMLLALVLTGGTASAQTAEPVGALPVVQKWVRFTDPQERAFTVAVPEGWKVEGGTFRWNALQYRFWLRVMTPDETTILAINDPSEFFSILPTQVLAGAGFHEGSLYSPTGVTFYRVASYRNGAQFAASWGQSRLASLCGEVRLLSNEAQPELTEEINHYAGLLGLRYDTGEAAFTCSADGLPMTAYVQATISSVGNQSGALWWPDPIVSFLSPTPVAGIAAGLVAQIIGSVELNPDWVSRQEGTNIEVARITAQTNAAISNTIVRGWADRGAVIDRVMEKGSRARLGIDVYVNPATGTEYIVPGNHNFYWVNPSGEMLTTETDDAPNGFTRLEHVPPS